MSRGLVVIEDERKGKQPVRCVPMLWSESDSGESESAGKAASSVFCLLHSDCTSPMSAGEMCSSAYGQRVYLGRLVYAI